MRGEEAAWFDWCRRVGGMTVQEAKERMGPTEFYGWVGVFEREANEKTAERWYWAQIAFYLDKLEHRVRGMFAQQPPFAKQIKDYLIPFVTVEPPAPPPVNDDSFEDREVVDPELDKVRRAVLSKKAMASWGRALGVATPGGRKPKIKTRVPLGQTRPGGK